MKDNHKYFRIPDVSGFPPTSSCVRNWNFELKKWETNHEENCGGNCKGQAYIITLDVLPPVKISVFDEIVKFFKEIIMKSQNSTSP